MPDEELEKRIETDVHSTSVHEGCPNATFVPAENHLVASLSVGSAEGEKDALQGLKWKLEEISEDIDDVKTNGSKLERFLVYKRTQMKDITFNVDRLA